VVQRQRNIIVMDDNYTRNGSNNANGLQIDRYFLDMGSGYISSHSKQSNALETTLTKLPTSYGKEDQQM
jgi:hypothetical protein